jgi:hypothetical protein
MARMKLCAPWQAVRPSLVLPVLALIALLGCKKSKLDYWGQPASPNEHLTPGFPEVAARLYSAIEQERQKLQDPDSEFSQIQAIVFREREATRKAVRSRVDRDLDFLLEGYVGKVDLLRNYRRIRNGAEYLPALTRQIDECHAELEKLFATRPMPRPSIGVPLSPCIERVPRTK